VHLDVTRGLLTIARTLVPFGTGHNTSDVAWG
jgi:hypothetical protein